MDEFNFEKLPTIIIDIGLRYSKVGFSLEPEPKKIIKSPEFFDLDAFLNDKLENGKLNTNNILAYQRDFNKVKFEIEEFINHIINYDLMIKKMQREKNYICLLLIDYKIKDNFKQIYEYIVETLFSYNIISTIRVSPKNIFPVFSSGYPSGIIVNCGYAYSTITVVNDGIDIYSREFDLSVSLLMKHYKTMILNDNKNIKEKHFSKKLNKYLEDILIRTCVIVNLKLSEKLYNDEKQIQGEENFTKVENYEGLEPFNISFLSRVKIGELLFDVNGENSLAYALCDIILNKIPSEIKKKVVSNIILSGGMTMLYGFYKRFIEEVTDWIQKDEFKKLATVIESMNMHQIILPRNCLSWIGASLLTNFDKLKYNKQIIKDEETGKLDKEISKLFE